jgi:hypothetical protein
MIEYRAVCVKCGEPITDRTAHGNHWEHVSLTTFDLPVCNDPVPETTYKVDVSECKHCDDLVYYYIANQGKPTDVSYHSLTSSTLCSVADPEGTKATPSYIAPPMPPTPEPRETTNELLREIRILKEVLKERTDVCRPVGRNIAVRPVRTRRR